MSQVNDICIYLEKQGVYNINLVTSIYFVAFNDILHRTMHFRSVWIDTIKY